MAMTNRKQRMGRRTASSTVAMPPRDSRRGTERRRIGLLRAATARDARRKGRCLPGGGWRIRRKPRRGSPAADLFNKDSSLNPAIPPRDPDFFRNRYPRNITELRVPIHVVWQQRKINVLQIAGQPIDR